MTTPMGGRSFTREGSGYPGSPEAPTTWDQLAQKFRDCAAVAARPPAPQQAELVVELVRDLESAPDVAVIIRRLQ